MNQSQRKLNGAPSETCGGESYRWPDNAQVTTPFSSMVQAEHDS
jgi:hypothetical protein